MTNAAFFGRTDSDNVAVLSADTITMNGCTVRVEAEAYVYAVANEDETEFTDFILKGEVK